MINRLPFIVKFYGAFQSPTHLFLVSDFFAGGELLPYIKKHRSGMPEASAVFYCAEILGALEGLHLLGIVYRDLKPENILMGADGHLALTDFGTATVSDSVTDVAGTLSYMPPEMVREDPCVCSCFLALGCCRAAVLRCCCLLYTSPSPRDRG